MKIVVLDGYTENPGDLSWGGLEALGEVTVYDRTSYAESPLIAERIGDAEIVVMNKTPISKETIDKCPNIRLIAVLATGYNVVDYNYAKEKGILVVNVPTYGTASVSQYSIALLLEICHHIGHHSESVHAGNWASNADWCYWDYPLIELEGKTIGIIGFGRIGQAEGRIAKALGMKVLAYDVYPNDSGRAIGEYVDLDTLLKSGRGVAALQSDAGEHGPDQQGEHREDEGRRDSDQQRTRSADRGAGCGGRAEQRQAGCGGSGCGLHRADQGGQPAAEGEELHHHAAYLVGADREPPAHHGYHRGERKGIPERNAAECSQRRIIERSKAARPLRRRRRGRIVHSPVGQSCLRDLRRNRQT